MQALCGLQGIFDLFNCKTPAIVTVLEMFCKTEPRYGSFLHKNTA